MEKLNTTLDQFADAIRNHLPVVCNNEDSWEIEGPIKAKLRHFFHRDIQRLEGVARAMILNLDHLEKIPVHFTNGGVQPVDFKGYLNAAEAVIEALGSLSKDLTCHLRRRVIGLKYRLEAVNGGADCDPVQLDLLHDLHKAANSWKHEQSIIYEKILTDNDLRKLKETTQYPEFAELLLDDPLLLKKFLEWTLRDKNSVPPFIQYPALQNKLVSCSLNGRIGRIAGGTTLKIKKIKEENDWIKIVTLPFEGRDISILDDQKKIEFRGHYQLTIAQVFEIFRNKYAKVGNLEFLEAGIVNWNVHHLGWWNDKLKKIQRIDLNKTDWWMQFPVYEIITKDQAQLRYGWHMNGVNWNAAATATRTTPTLDVDQNHAYLEVAIPIDSVHYAIYPFGKFAYEFPTTFFENLSIFCRNVHATVAFPDENVFYTHRQHASHSFVLTPSEGFRLMDAIKHDIKRSRGNNLVFQIESENCAKWVHESLEKALGDQKIPNLYRIPLLHTEPAGLVKSIFNLIKKLPASLQKPVLTALHLPFGAASGTWIEENGKKVLKSMTSHHFWETTEIYLPAFLHKQKEEGSLAAISLQPKLYAKPENIPDFSHSMQLFKMMLGHAPMQQSNESDEEGNTPMAQVH